jgi:hypothetical protein
MAHTQSQAPEVGANMRDDVAQTIVSARSATKLEPRFANRQIELIVRHQDLCRRDFYIVADRTHRQTAAIHIGHRLEQRDLVSAELNATDIALKTRVAAEMPTLLGCERVDEPEPSIVTREQMLRPRVAETDDDFKGSAWHGCDEWGVTSDEWE